MDIFDFFSMAGEIAEFFKAAGEDIGNLFNPKKKRPFIHRPDDKPTQWGSDSYEPWDFLTDEQWAEILRGDKSLEDFTMSHAWPPEKQDEQNNEEEQENEQEQEDSESAELSEPDDSINPDENLEAESDAFESGSSFGEGDSDADYDSSDSGSCDGDIG